MVTWFLNLERWGTYLDQHLLEGALQKGQRGANWGTPPIFWGASLATKGAAHGAHILCLGKEGGGTPPAGEKHQGLGPPKGGKSTHRGGDSQEVFFFFSLFRR